MMFAEGKSPPQHVLLRSTPPAEWQIANHQSAQEQKHASFTKLVSLRRCEDPFTGARRYQLCHDSVRWEPMPSRAVRSCGNHDVFARESTEFISIAAAAVPRGTLVISAKFRT